MPFSSTSTSTPARANHQPALRPVTPPPMMTTAAPRAVVMGASSSFSGGRLHKGLQATQLVGGDVTGDAVTGVELLNRRRCVVADGAEAAGTARGERASPQNLVGTWHRALEQDAGAGVIGIGHRHRRQQRLGIG